ncbi:hypothetical protein [Nonomuraea roseola]|uniref:Uncharacterized protein n=1 Tax=Nonomuraea roseola TaxID=46179 RepID=A0ABV5QCB8_9ACTN
MTRTTVMKTAAGLAAGLLLVSASPAVAQAKEALGPFGYGGVKLGMSAKTARATGKIVAKTNDGGCSGWDLKAHPTGENAVGMFISKKRGVAVIFAAKGVKTPQGIGLGSTTKQLKRAYPRLKTSASGYPYVSVEGNPKAYYSFLVSRGRVYEMALGLNTQDCVN